MWLYSLVLKLDRFIWFCKWWVTIFCTKIRADSNNTNQAVLNLYRIMGIKFHKQFLILWTISTLFNILSFVLIRLSWMFKMSCKYYTRYYSFGMEFVYSI